MPMPVPMRRDGQQPQRPAAPPPNPVYALMAASQMHSEDRLLAQPADTQSPTSNFEAAKSEMNLTPQEQALYQRHLTNLNGPGGIDNPDGSRSTLSQTTIEAGGKVYNIPTVWDGKRLSGHDAADRAVAEGINKFPSYATEDEAESRYQQMHSYMAKDTGKYLRSRK